MAIVNFVNKTLSLLLFVWLFMACGTAVPSATPTAPPPVQIFSLAAYGVSDPSILVYSRSSGEYEAYVGDRLVGNLMPTTRLLYTLLVEVASGEQFMVGVVLQPAQRVDLSLDRPRDANIKISASVRPGGFFIAPLFAEVDGQRINLRVNGIAIVPLQ